ASAGRQVAAQARPQARAQLFGELAGAARLSAARAPAELSVDTAAAPVESREALCGADQPTAGAQRRAGGGSARARSVDIGVAQRGRRCVRTWQRGGRRGAMLRFTDPGGSPGSA